MASRRSERTNQQKPKSSLDFASNSKGLVFFSRKTKQPAAKWSITFCSLSTRDCSLVISGQGRSRRRLIPVSAWVFGTAISGHQAPLRRTSCIRITPDNTPNSSSRALTAQNFTSNFACRRDGIVVSLSPSRRGERK